MKWLIATCCGLYACYCINFCGSLMIVSVEEEWCHLATLLKKAWKRATHKPSDYEHVAVEEITTTGKENEFAEKASSSKESIVSVSAKSNSQSQSRPRRHPAPNSLDRRLDVRELRHRGSSSESNGRLLNVFPERLQNLPISGPLHTSKRQYFVCNVLRLRHHKLPIEF